MPASAHYFDFGVYDAAHEFDALTVFALEHVIVSWAGYSSGSLTALLNGINSRARTPLLTLELWPEAAFGSTFASLMDDILAGKYDPRLSAMCTDINAASLSPGGLFLRPMPEMEVVAGVYPWAVLDYGKSIAVWQYLVRYFRGNLAANRGVSYVWSPVGDDPRLSRYFPGTGFVDLCGCSLYTAPVFELDFYKMVRPFSAALDAKYANLAPFNKTIMVAESGVTSTGCLGAGSLFGDKGFQRKHLFDLFNAIKNNRYPLLKHYVYYQAVDPYDFIFNGVDYGKMSWKCSPHIFLSWLGGT